MLLLLENLNLKFGLEPEVGLTWLLPQSHDGHGVVRHVKVWKHGQVGQAVGQMVQVQHLHHRRHHLHQLPLDPASRLRSSIRAHPRAPRLQSGRFFSDPRPRELQGTLRSSSKRLSSAHTWDASSGFRHRQRRGGTSPTHRDVAIGRAGRAASQSAVGVCKRGRGPDTPASEDVHKYNQNTDFEVDKVGEIAPF